MAKKVADFYVNKQGSKYSPIYVTPESTAVPTLERWVVLLLTDKALLDFSNPQKFVTLPLNLVDKHFLGVLVDRKPERD